MTLGPPPRSLQHTALPTVTIAAAKLFRISRHSTEEPHFGRSGANRFDDPNRVVSKRYGTCYCGLGLDTAIAETVLHDEVAVKNQFNIASSEILSRYLVRFRGENLELADMTGSRLKFMGGEGSLSTVIPYTLTQRWSRAVHSHPRGVDGMYYMSRHLNDQPAIVLFDRARRKLESSHVQPLHKARHLADVLLDLHISFQFP